MMREVLRDRHGNRIGELTYEAGKTILRDRHGNRLGEYHHKDNVTRDRRGGRLGYGNLLASLLTPLGK